MSKPIQVKTLNSLERGDPKQTAKAKKTPLAKDILRQRKTRGQLQTKSEAIFPTPEIMKFYLRTAFDLLDRDQDGHVTPEELQFMLRNLGIHVRDELIDDLLREASRTGEFWGKTGRKRYLSCDEDRLEENFDYQESSFCRKQ
ncbi:calcium-binding protein E63-1 [Culex quinquefasciatus]|uniref:Calcium-binding protein E63-1 n=1 Tax=Culex quinquefasciatus TaxID=7176 RepID=B0X8X7_CULQU|nr:calcium-binding protein E63-1 [Culex quinquefasciatus]|eukprot:XP_001866099.1 calcium-binding protein E63-1 [Culex quinquefasciatus]